MPGRCLGCPRIPLRVSTDVLRMPLCRMGVEYRSVKMAKERARAVGGLRFEGART